MPGQIKIDDGAGNYTILTNAGSLGSDKTITIPNETATLATTNGITVADQWRLTANITNTTGDITTNLERIDNTISGIIGSGVTESSGIFSFPSTGIWYINVSASQTSTNVGDNNFYLKGTDDNFSTEFDLIRLDGDNSNGSSANWVSSGNTIIDVTDTANIKVKMYINQTSTGAILMGSTGFNRTSITFIRLGDT
jgi:hypothetical protein